MEPNEARPRKVLTLCIVHKGTQVLLGMKKRGFGAGRWNGFGGKVMQGEEIEGAALREAYEEAGIEIQKPEKIGFIEFEFQGQPEILEVHVFKAREFLGSPVETEEMRPKWFAVNEIPYAEMWPDDIYWIPLFLDNKVFKAYFLFGEGNMVIKHELKEVPPSL